MSALSDQPSARRSGSRWLDVVLVCLMIAVMGGGVHLWLTERLAVLQAFFVSQSQPVKWSTQCSANAPDWMAKMMNAATSLLVSPANQLAYISPDGELHHCENGWLGGMFSSPRVDVATRYRYASVSKVFTAHAILTLANRGQLDLNAPLMEFFPEIRDPQDERVAHVNLKQLLSHRAGFDRLRSEDPTFKHNHKSWCPYDLEELSRLRLDFYPGERYAYSNRGYCLLGQVVERVTGQSFRDYLELEYRLHEHGIRFVDGPYQDDEVQYDFRTSEFYGPAYSEFFDFPALSPVAGLSGSASALVAVTNDMIQREGLNLRSADLGSGCNSKALQECYGYSVYRYAASGQLVFYINDGFFPGTMPMLIFDSEGGTLALLPSGTPVAERRNDNKKQWIDKLYLVLMDFYRTG